MITIIVCLVLLIPACALGYHFLINHHILKSNKHPIREIGNNRKIFSMVRDILLQGEEVSVAVRGQSMLPFFLSGQTIHLRPLKDGEIKKGHVVLADTGKNFVVHRIIKIEAEVVTLFGDGNIKATEKVKPEMIYGIVKCSKAHLFLARIWLWIRPLRRYPLWIIKRITPK
ncbi:MAG: S24/S26 family peptidase [Alistipes sp.]|nr:S24/S26 family peptidase [Candidatus Alistipes equi]